MGGPTGVRNSKDGIEHLLLEEELELQLGLLKRHSETDVSLFPEEMAPSLPHLKDNVPDESHPEHHDELVHFHKPTPSEILAVEETLLEENTLETIMFCLVMAAFIFAPQLLHA